MNDNKDILKTQDADLTPVSATPEDIQLTDADLENVSGGVLDAHGNVCIGVGAMATIQTGGTQNN